jgi:hypothetical protein
VRVVGTSRMRDVDPGWPAPGTKLHHSFGMWPLLIDDTTEAIEIEPGERLVLEAREAGRKGSSGDHVNAAANGSLVSIAEDVTDGPYSASPSAGTGGRHPRTQPRDTAPARLPRRRPHVRGPTGCKPRVYQCSSCRIHAAGPMHAAPGCAEDQARYSPRIGVLALPQGQESAGDQLLVKRRGDRDC